MPIFKHWNGQGLQGIELLEAHEDWLIHITDTLGYTLAHACTSYAMDECLDRLLHGIRDFLQHEPLLLANPGYPLDENHQCVHHRLLIELDHLAQRHYRGEPVGEHLLGSLQDWLIDHCGRLHSQVLH